MTPRTVHIALEERSYGIHIGEGLLASVPDFVPLDLKGRNLFVVTDENVASTHAASVLESLKSCKPRKIELMALPPGEQTKSFEMLERVTGWLLDHGVDRDSVLFAVGGGVIGDLAGFAASVILRGIPFVQVPTTLLAQVDSSVGGKTAINMPQGKNMVGAFYQPRAVICDTSTLITLPSREILAGYAETVKYGLIGDPEFFIWLERDGTKVCGLETEPLVRAVETSCRKKAEIVTADETEKGARALLNLGHTFGHALEAAAGYGARLLHGEAVAVGMVLAFRLSERLGLCNPTDADRVESHLEKAGLPVRINQIVPLSRLTPDEIMDYMKGDKKASAGKKVFILAHGIGKAFVYKDAPDADVREIIKISMNRS